MGPRAYRLADDPRRRERRRRAARPRIGDLGGGEGGDGLPGAGAGALFWNRVMTPPWLASLTALTVAATALPAQKPDSAPAAPPAPATPKAATPRPPKSSSKLITVEDIARARPTVGSAYDVVQLLRPQWLRTPRNMLNLPG